MLISIWILFNHHSKLESLSLVFYFIIFSFLARFTKCSCYQHLFRIVQIQCNNILVKLSPSLISGIFKWAFINFNFKLLRTVRMVNVKGLVPSLIAFRTLYFCWPQFTAPWKYFIVIPTLNKYWINYTLGIWKYLLCGYLRSMNKKFLECMLPKSFTLYLFGCQRMR